MAPPIAPPIPVKPEAIPTSLALNTSVGIVSRFEIQSACPMYIMHVTAIASSPDGTMGAKFPRASGLLRR
jgi:hypothetical protein